VSRRFAAWLALAANGTVRAAAVAAQEPADTLPRASVDSTAETTVDRTADSLLTPQRYKNKIFGLPFVGYSPTTKFIFGAGGAFQFKSGQSAYDTATRASNVSAGFSITTAGQWGITLSNDYFTLGNRWWYSGKVQAGFAPTDFYGVGPFTDPHDANRMDQMVVRLEGKVLRRLSRTVFFGPYYRLHAAWNVDFHDPVLVPSGLHGRDGSTSSGLGLTALTDSRNSILTPTSGHFVVLDALANLQILGSEYDYPYLLFDARQYVPLDKSRNHVLALNLYGQFNGPNVPLQTMAQISSFTTQQVMRGVYFGRFRDRHDLIAQVDYRVHVWKRFGAVVYGAAGNVFGSNGAQLGDHMKYTYGGGIRFNLNPRDPINLRLDYTLTSFGEKGLSIGAGEAF
jgi:hypothetical protein